MKKYLAIVLFSVLSFGAFAQHSVQGKVLDKKDESVIEAATIRLLNAKDSSLVEGKFTDNKGQFVLPKIKDGNYILQVRFLGYEVANQSFSVAGKNVLLKTTYLTEIENALNAIEVTGMAAQMQVKGDTIEYNPAAFKLSENAVVEDLLKKMPGVQVDADGNVTVNGQQIKQVRVDGKKFFTGDVQMATRNITVDMLDKVQVIDQKSDMAKLTGFEDENTERIINLTLKANRRNGVFGNIGAGAGFDRDKIFRYDANATTFFMNGSKAQTTVTGRANNINSMASGRGRGGISGGNGGGLTSTQNLGVNYNIEMNKNLKLGGNASYNHTNSTSTSYTERENYQDSLTIFSNSNQVAVQDNNTANIQFEAEWNVDTLSTLLIQPSFSYSKSSSSSHGDNFSLEENSTLLTTDTISSGNSWSNSNTDGINGSINLIYNRKLPSKKGRNLTLNAGSNTSDQNTDGMSYSYKYTPRRLQQDTTIMQRNANISNSFGTNLRVSFVEPLWNQKNLLEIAGSLRSSSTKSERIKYNDLDGDQNFTDIDSMYSNRFRSNSYNESFDLNYRYQGETFNYVLGISAQPSQTFNKTYYLDGDTLDRKNIVTNYSPNASIRYTFAKRSFIRMEYRGRTSQPSIDQMQPVKSNSLTYETVGNPGLNPSFAHTMTLSYSKFNEESLSSINSSISGTYTIDALVSNSIYDATGKQYSQTINSVNAPFSGNASFSFNAPIIKNRLQFNTQTSANYSQRYGYSDRSRNAVIYLPNGDLRMGKMSVTNSGGVSENINLTLSTDMLEIGLRGSVRYNRTQNNLNNNKPQETYDYSLSGNVTLTLPYNWTINNDFSYATRSGYSSLSQDEMVWNASIEKSVLNRKGTVSLKLDDILGQRLNIRESIGDASRSLTRTNMLRSYFILSFAYRLASFGGGMGGGMRGGMGGGMRSSGGGMGGGGGMRGGGF